MRFRRSALAKLRWGAAAGDDAAAAAASVGAVHDANNNDDDATTTVSEQQVHSTRENHPLTRHTTDNNRTLPAKNTAGRVNAETLIISRSTREQRTNSRRTRNYELRKTTDRTTIDPK